MIQVSKNRYATMSAFFNQWCTLVWRKKRESVLELRLEHAVWELNDAKLNWEGEVMRLENELAVLTGAERNKNNVSEAELVRTRRPPPVPKSKLVDFGQEGEQEEAGECLRAALGACCLGAER